METVRILQGYSIHFVHDGLDIYINPDTWDMEKERKLKSQTGLQCTYVGKEPVFYNPAHWAFSSRTGFSLKRGINKPTQIYNLKDYSSLFLEYDGDSIDLSHWDMSEVTDMSYMFEESNLVSVDLSGWNVRNVQCADEMFRSCKNLLAVSLDGLNFASLTSVYRMFIGCDRLYSFSASGTVCRKLENAANMFVGCQRLQKCDLSNADLTNLQNVSEMFYGCEMLQAAFFPTNARYVQNACDLFFGCISLAYTNMGDMVWPNCFDMSNLFMGCRRIVTVKLPYTAADCSLNHTFLGCAKLEFVDLSGVRNIYSIKGVFEACLSLHAVNVCGCSLCDDANCTDAFASSGIFAHDIVEKYGDALIFRSIVRRQNIEGNQKSV